MSFLQGWMTRFDAEQRDGPVSGHPYCAAGPVSGRPYCAPALGNRTRLGGFTPFHNPTGGVRRHLPLHKGGFSLLHCIQLAFVLLLSAGAVPCRDGHTVLPHWETEPDWVGLPRFTIPPAAFAATSLCTREAFLCFIASNQSSFYCLARERSRVGTAIFSLPGWTRLALSVSLG